MLFSFLRPSITKLETNQATKMPKGVALSMTNGRNLRRAKFKPLTIRTKRARSKNRRQTKALITFYSIQRDKTMGVNSKIELGRGKFR